MSCPWFVPQSFECTLCFCSRSLRHGKEKKEKGRGAGGSAGRNPDGARVPRTGFPSLSPSPHPHAQAARRNSWPAAGREQCRGRTATPRAAATHHPGQCPVAASSRAAAARLGHGWCLRSQAPRPRPPLLPPRWPPGPAARTERSARRAPSGAAPSAPSPRPGADARSSPLRRPRRLPPSNSRRGGRVARA